MIPDILTRKGLFVAVNEFIEDVNTRTSMHIVFNCQPAPVSLHMQLHIYRMIQEMITNAVRHSGGTRMSINIALKNDRLILEVSDNGKGFDTGANYTSSGLGIKNIFGRTRLLHGDMYLNSGFGMGTTYNIEIPIACNELQDTIDDRG
jgi:signal transduction histidine kinase